MSGGRRPGATSVFIGNIPYGVTEDDLKKIFSTAGPVESMRCAAHFGGIAPPVCTSPLTRPPRASPRLVLDRETNKPKGYGFCEFRDAETAASAIRNLNNHPINGRQLRVDSADNDTKPSKGGGSRQEAGGTAGPGPGGNLMPQAEGAPDFLVGMSERQVFEVLVQFKVRLAFASLSWLH